MTTKTPLSLCHRRRLPAIPTSHQDGCLSVVVTKKKKPLGILCIGGSNNNSNANSSNNNSSNNNSVDFLEWKTKRWWSLPSMTGGNRSGCASATLDDDTTIVVCGGISTETQERLKTAETMNFVTKEWQCLQHEMSTCRWYPAAVAVDTTISSRPLVWVGGGRNEKWEELSSCECYNFQTHQWKSMASMSFPRFACAAVRYANKLDTAVDVSDVSDASDIVIVLGGYNGQEWMTSVEVYDVEKDEWCHTNSSTADSNNACHTQTDTNTGIITAIPPIPTSLTFPSACVIEVEGERVIVCAGGVATDDEEDDISIDPTKIASTATAATKHCSFYYSLKQGKWILLQSASSSSKKYNFDGSSIASIGDNNLVSVGGKTIQKPGKVQSKDSNHYRLHHRTSSMNTASNVSEGDDDATIDTNNRNVYTWKLNTDTDSHINNHINHGSSKNSISKSNRHRSPRKASAKPVLPPEREIPLPNFDGASASNDDVERSDHPFEMSGSTIMTPSTVVKRSISIEPPIEALNTIFAPSAFASYPSASGADYWSCGTSSTTGMETTSTDDTTLTSASTSPKIPRHKTKTKSVQRYKTTDSKGQDVLYTGKIDEVTETPHGKGIMKWNYYENINNHHGDDDDSNIESAIVGDVYEGEFAFGLRDGHGTMTYFSSSTSSSSSNHTHQNDTYRGMFHKDRKHGLGVYTWKSGKQYEGHYRNGKAEDSNGTLTFPDGTVYIGDFASGERTGKGIMRFRSKARYQGDFVNGKYHGRGTMIFSDRKEYTGNWKRGKAHGAGKLSRRDGKVIHDGEWCDDAPVVEKKDS